MGSYELYVWILMALRNDHSFKELSFKMKEKCKVLFLFIQLADLPDK